MARRYLLRTPRIRELVDEHHLNHADVAARLGVSRAYWSALVNGRHALTPSVRRRILECEVFAGVAEAELWERVETPLREAS
jgi:transcriptional regulator with XRE-family HTH domain